MMIKVFMVNKKFYDKTKKINKNKNKISVSDKKDWILATTFRSWNNREKMVGFSPEI